MLGMSIRGRRLKASRCPTQAIPVYTCYFGIASMRSAQKESFEKQIIPANPYSVQAKRSRMYSVYRGGVNPPLRQAQE